MNRFKKKIFLLFIGIISTSCYLTNSESEMLISPSNNYFINAKVNRTEKNKNNYADVIIYVYDKNKREIVKFNSHAGDFSQWTLGWTKTGDTILLQSSDINNQAWIIRNKKTEKICLTKSLNRQAEDLFKVKQK